MHSGGDGADSKHVSRRLQTFQQQLDIFQDSVAIVSGTFDMYLISSAVASAASGAGLPHLAEELREVNRELALLIMSWFYRNLFERTISDNHQPVSVARYLKQMQSLHASSSRDASEAHLRDSRSACRCVSSSASRHCTDFHGVTRGRELALTIERLCGRQIRGFTSIIAGTGGTVIALQRASFPSSRITAAV
jgi:hypothetical protein